MNHLRIPPSPHPNTSKNIMLKAAVTGDHAGEVFPWAGRQKITRSNNGQKISNNKLDLNSMTLLSMLSVMKLIFTATKNKTSRAHNL